jgi:C-terminal processing protease CtpA/Prc
VGAVFGRDNDTRSLYVREVPPGLAAAEAGLLPGDQIVMIEGFYVRDLDAKAIRDKLRGDVGTAVALTVLRGQDVLRLRVPRGAKRDHEAIPPKETRFRE